MLLELSFQAEKYGALPHSGGLLDQPAGMLKKMASVRSVHYAFSERKRAGNKNVAAWRSEHKELHEIIKTVEAIDGGEQTQTDH